MVESSLREQLVEAVGLIETLRAQNEALRDRVAFLEAELAKDSSNSSKPPSSDPVGPRKKRAERRAEQREATKANKRNQGKQPGAPGAHLQRRRPDRIVEHQPRACSCCGADLTDAVVVGSHVRQVIDLPAIAAVVTDHVMVRRRCGCGTESSGEWPAEAKAPVCWGPEVRSFAVYLLVRQHLPVERCAELLADLLDAPVSTGWLIGVQAQAATNLAPFMAELKARLGVCPVVHADETGTRVRTTKHWMHTLTTNLLTLVAVHPKRGAEAIRDIGVLGGFTGTVVHDGWASYDTFTAASHAQCGAHLLRHLQDVGTTPAFATWTAQMIKNLLDAKRASEAAAAAGQPAVDVATANAIRGRYHDTVDVALHLLPAGAPPPRRHRGGWNTAQRKAYNLAARMRRDADQVLRLLDDTRVPFDNNTAERALRMVKLSVYRPWGVGPRVGV